MNFTTTQNGGTIPLEQRRGIMDEVVVPNRPRGRHSKGGRNKLPSGEKAITKTFISKQEIEMKSYLTDWPDSSASGKDELISYCDNSLALVRVMEKYKTNTSFVRDALSLLEKQCSEIDGAIASLIRQVESNPPTPLWVMDALRLRGAKPSPNLVDLMKTNHRALGFFNKGDPIRQKEALALMKATFKEMIFVLQGKKWHGKSLPPKP